MASEGSLPHGYITIARAGYVNKYVQGYVNNYRPYMSNRLANMTSVLVIPPSEPENRGSQDYSDHYTTRITFATLRSLRSPENPTVFLTLSFDWMRRQAAWTTRGSRWRRGQSCPSWTARPTAGSRGCVTKVSSRHRSPMGTACPASPTSPPKRSVLRSLLNPNI